MTVDATVRCKKIRQIAGELGISYDAVKRQRRMLLAQVSTELEDRRSATLLWHGFPTVPLSRRTLTKS